VAVSRWQGVPREHQWGLGVAPGKAVGQHSPEQRCDVAAVEEHRDSGVRWWGESSGGRWRWRRDPVASVWKREGEGGLN
jgi:hypothetical protein